MYVVSPYNTAYFIDSLLAIALGRTELFETEAFSADPWVFHFLCPFSGSRSTP